MSLGQPLPECAELTDRSVDNCNEAHPRIAPEKPSEYPKVEQINPKTGHKMLNLSRAQA